MMATIFSVIPKRFRRSAGICFIKSIIDFERSYNYQKQRCHAGKNPHSSEKRLFINNIFHFYSTFIIVDIFQYSMIFACDVCNIRLLEKTQS